MWAAGSKPWGGAEGFPVGNSATIFGPVHGPSGCSVYAGLPVGRDELGGDRRRLQLTRAHTDTTVAKVTAG